VDRGIATVKIDGVDRGTAPLTALVNAGHHTVVVDGPVDYTSPSTGVVVASLDTVRVLFSAAKKK
jgi:PEGA domain